MRIVPQFASASYSRLLALPAPQIAGLLPSGITPPAPYVFDRPALADLTTDQREKLFTAVDMLIEIAIEHLVGTFNEQALRAAEVLFHRAAGGTSPLKLIGPAAFHAEVDADWLELIAASKRVRPMSNSEAESIIDVIRARQKSGVA